MLFRNTQITHKNTEEALKMVIAVSIEEATSANRF